MGEEGWAARVDFCTFRLGDLMCALQPTEPIWSTHPHPPPSPLSHTSYTERACCYRRSPPACLLSDCTRTTDGQGELNYNLPMRRRHPLHPTMHLILLLLALLLAFFTGTSRSMSADSIMVRTKTAFMSAPTPPAGHERRRPPFTPKYPSSRRHAGGSTNDDGGRYKAKKERQQKEKDKLSALMAKQEREAVKKYMEKEAKKDLESQAKIRQAQAYMAERAKGGGKDAPWTKSTDGTGSSGGSSQSPPKKKGPKFQQISLTCRQFSIDDIQDVTFEGSHLVDVPFLGLPEVAVFGRSNVGKSSMLNCLTGNNKKVAVVSKTPGRTQQINLFKVHDSNGPVAVLVDLPGYGYAKLPKALQSDIGTQVRQYLSDRPTLRLAVLLMDARRDPQKSDLNMMKYFRAANVPLLVLGTKVDKLNQEEIGPNLGKLNQYFKLPEGMPVAFSSVTGVNKRAVWNAIRDACVGEYLDLSEEAQEANALVQKLSQGKDEKDN